MNNKILLSAAIILASLSVSAQSTVRSYAITGKPDNTFFWADIKEIDISTGKIVKTVFETGKSKFTVKNNDQSDMTVPSVKNPTFYGAAACALDTRHNRLYFAPMHFSEICYVDLSKSEPEFVVVKRNVIQLPAGASYQPEENHLTKMVIAADGNGYALTNDGNHLIRFSTGRKAFVEDLGRILDAENNNGFSIHEKVTGWGGDMVADAFGNLVVVTAKHHIYSIDVHSKVATHLGEIKGLPENYTTNGAVVASDGNLVVSSANVLDNLYTVSTEDFTATKIVSTDRPFNASDMANGTLLSQKKFDLLRQGGISSSVSAIKTGLKVYPNPVSGKSFNLLIDGNLEGNHQIVLTDIDGKILQANTAVLTKGSRLQLVTLKTKYTSGTYLVKVLDASGKCIYSDKIIIR